MDGVFWCHEALRARRRARRRRWSSLRLVGERVGRRGGLALRLREARGGIARVVENGTQ